MFVLHKNAISVQPDPITNNPDRDGGRANDGEASASP
jgi:hypothetical protein